LLGTLATIVEAVAASNFAAPAVAVVGNTVKLHSLLSGGRF
jgi:siroheme synthase